MTDRETILQALHTISLIKPEQIEDVTIKDTGTVGIILSLPPIDPNLRDAIVQQCKAKVMPLEGVKDVWVKIGVALPSVREPVGGVAQVQHIIAVSSGKGGVGKTSVAVNLAVALAEMGYKVGLLDADIYGPNVPLMLGMQDASLWVERDEQGQEVVEPAFNYGVKMISMAFLIDRDQPVMWRGPMLDGMLKKFLHQAKWGELDFLLVDMPPGTGDVQISLAQSVPLTGAIVVTTPQTVALLDARKGLRMFQNLRVPILGIVENMSYFVPPDLPDRQYDIFGSGGGTKTAKELGIPLLGCIPLEMQLRESSDKGVPMVLAQPQSPSAQALKQVAQALCQRVFAP
ncbi:MAG: Mrp/NBP35 family ATP-binding protein [Pseudanabaenaceae cyanobacterium SKYGB_i_bin29]|nr:Mrp/NBP35 family ATP-binding protein [Pseudanabaenaceae cyanobacterium SKYG29]MDW8422422.1 Mrp/NBP35 family ATP-binding protein [Pseudanabaenaceae cyanobacterium SKYGB_i_bin29]